MRIHPLFKWFGSKWSATKAGLYPEPRFPTIFEPYAGSAGYSLNYADRKVVLVERDPHCLALWRWLITQATQSAILEIPIGLPIGTDIGQVGLTAGQALLLKSWQRTNNVGGCMTISKWGHLPGQWTANTRARVAEEVSAIKHWGIGYVPEPCTIFVDPPYKFNYAYRQPPIDYINLSLDCRLAQAAGAQVIVCEAEGKKGEVPSWLPFKPLAKRVTSRRKASEHHHSSELIWLGDDAR